MKDREGKTKTVGREPRPKPSEGGKYGDVSTPTVLAEPESAGIGEIVDFVARATEVFGDRTKALRGLRTPIPSLGDETPQAMLQHKRGMKPDRGRSWPYRARRTQHHQRSASFVAQRGDRVDASSAARRNERGNSTDREQRDQDNRECLKIVGPHTIQQIYEQPT
jgi:hypothetical protein